MKRIFAIALATGLGFTASMFSIESASAQQAPAFSSNTGGSLSSSCAQSQSCDDSLELLAGVLGVAAISGGIYALTNNHNNPPEQVSP